MSPVVWIALWILPVAALAAWLWRREARRLGVTVGPVKALALVGLVLLGGVLYLVLGYRPETGQWLSQYREMLPSARQLIAGHPAEGLGEDTDIRALAMTLQRELTRHPTAAGWYTLAMIYNESGRGDLAVDAARRSLALASEQQATQARMMLARSLITRDNGQLTPESEQLLRQVIADQPDHDGAWTLMATAAARAGRHRVAEEAFQSLLSRHGDGEVGDMLRQGLARARNQARLQSAYEGLQVTVTAAEQLQPGGTLFLFLRREGGNGQPLAARRYLVNDFPAILTLRQQDWLQGYPDPAAKLVIGARYSSAPGGDVEAASLRAEPVPLSGEAGNFHAELHLAP